MLPAGGKHTCRTPRGPGWVTQGTLGVAPRTRGAPAALRLQVQGNPGGLQWEPPEKPTLCWSTTISDPQNGSRTGGYQLSYTPRLSGVPVPVHRGSPQCQGEPRAMPMALLDSPMPWAAGRSRRSSGSMVRAAGCRGQGVRVLGLRVPVGPACGHQNRPHSCRGRSPVANRLGSFPRQRLLCLSARRRGVLRTAAFVARVVTAPAEHWAEGISHTPQTPPAAASAPHTHTKGHQARAPRGF